MRHFFVYGGKSSLDFGVHLSGEATWDKPAPDVETVSIPGRSGDLTFFGGRYENVEITYRLGIMRDFDRNYTGLANYLLSSPGYHRLEDSYHPDVYRMALLASKLTPEMAPRNRRGEIEVTFNCKPQCWLKSGETAKIFTTNGKIYNPTLFTAKPLLRVYGTGTIGIGSQTLTIAEANEYTDIDCESMEAYKGDASVNCNGKIKLSSGAFPELPPGETGISLGTGITKIVLTPRWWKL